MKKRVCFVIDWTMALLVTIIGSIFKFVIELGFILAVAIKQSLDAITTLFNTWVQFVKDNRSNSKEI